jgi:hypothetical protein
LADQGVGSRQANNGKKRLVDREGEKNAGKKTPDRS